MNASENYRTLAKDLRRRADMPGLVALRGQALALAVHFEALAEKADAVPPEAVRALPGDRTARQSSLSGVG